MIGLYTFLAIYLLGGLTFLPLLFYGVFYLVTLKVDDDPQLATTTIPKTAYPDEPYKDVDKDQSKRGWIRLTNLQHGQTIGRWNTNTSTSASKRPKDLVYGVLKHGTLFVYESEQLADCKMIIPVHDYTVAIYPYDRGEHGLFGRSTAICLKPKHDPHRRKLDSGIRKSHTDTELLGSECSLDQDIFLKCSRPIDKEDWYFALIAASKFMADTPDLGHVETMDGTHFDVEAIHAIIKMIHQDPEQREVKWLNAVMGRLFLGVYKTEQIDRFLKKKIVKKVQKIKTPAFLEEITVHHVHVGQTIPYLSRFKLVSMDVDGHLIAEAHMDYVGGLCVEIGTGFILPGYSSKMKSIRVLLSVTLKRFSGKFQFKIKAPPTNRCWVGFYDMPQMDLDIKPIVSDKQVKLNLVTNAIESKIKEVIAETMVLPNMDDFVFFYTEEGKGGIFGRPVPRPVDMTSIHQKEDIEDSSTFSSSSSSSGSLPEIDQHNQHTTSKSAPDLLKSAAAAASTIAPASNNTDTASMRSTDSLDSATTATSSSSSIRWAVRRKKRASSDTAPIPEDTSVRRRSFLAKISPLHESAANMATGNERRNSLNHKEYAPSPAREENPRIAKYPPPPPPPFPPSKPAQHCPTLNEDEQNEPQQIDVLNVEVAAKPEVPIFVVNKPPLPPRQPHSPLSANSPVVIQENAPVIHEVRLPPPPMPPRQRSTSLGEKPPLPPRSPRLSDASPSTQQLIASLQTPSSPL